MSNVTFLPDGVRAEARGSESGELFPIPRDLVDRIARALGEGPWKASEDAESKELYQAYAAEWQSMKGYAVRVDLDYLHCTLLWLQDTLSEDVELEVGGLLALHDKSEGKEADLTPAPLEVVYTPGDDAQAAGRVFRNVPTPQAVFKNHASNIAKDWCRRPEDPTERDYSCRILEGKFAALAECIADHCGDGGPTTHALNKLRESQMWAFQAFGQVEPGYIEGMDQRDSQSEPCPECLSYDGKHKMSCNHRGLVFTDG